MKERDLIRCFVRSRRRVASRENVTLLLIGSQGGGEDLERANLHFE
jgi:hypothetical protein